jgi:hypothetical protein
LTKNTWNTALGNLIQLFHFAEWILVKINSHYRPDIYSFGEVEINFTLRKLIESGRNYLLWKPTGVWKRLRNGYVTEKRSNITQSREA